MRRLAVFPWVLALTGCFEDEVPETETDSVSVMTDPSASTSAGDSGTSGSTSSSDDSATSTSSTSLEVVSTSGPGPDASSSVDATTIDAATTTEATEGDGETEGEDATEGEGSTGDPGPLGPQIVRSVPSDGDMAAPLTRYFFLYFDRVVSPNDATGHIFVSQAGGEPVPVAPLQCPPDYDPTCIAAVFPASFQDSETEQLPGNTAHRIIVEADFADPDGVTNRVDQVVEFTTLDFTSDAFDDSATINSELGGIAYDPTNENLYLFGSTSSRECVVRRIPLRDGDFGTGQTVATPITGETGQDVCYGASLYDGALYVTLTYNDHVVRYNDLSLDDLSLDQFVFGPDTGLPDPDETLAEVWSVAAYQERVFFSFGNFHGGVSSHSILEYAERTFSVFNNGDNLWTPESDQVVIATGIVDGVASLFAHDGDQIHKFRLSDGSRIGGVDIDDQYSPHLFVDGYDRLYASSGDGLDVYDATTMEPLRSLGGFEASRFAVVAAESSAVIYTGEYRRPAVIGRVSVDF